MNLCYTSETYKAKANGIPCDERPQKPLFLNDIMDHLLKYQIMSSESGRCNRTKTLFKDKTVTVITALSSALFCFRNKKKVHPTNR